MPHVIVEDYLEVALDPKVEADMTRRVDEEIAARGGHIIRTYTSPDHRREVCEFEAPSAQAVADSFAAAGHPVETIWEADVWKA